MTLNILFVACDRHYLEPEGRAMMPVGLMYLSSFLKHHLKDVQLNVDLLDLGVDQLEAAESLAHQPDLIGLRSVSINDDVARDVARRMKHLFPSALVVLGGPSLNADSRSPMHNTHIDYGVVGEGEQPLLEMARCLVEDRQDRIREIAGVVYRDPASGALRDNPAVLLEDLDAHPWPDYALLDLEKYSRVITRARVSCLQGAIISSRGCPYRCIYCHNIFGRKLRLRSAVSVFEEIKYLHETHGFRDFSVLDDAFNLDKERLINTQKILERYFSAEDIRDFYSSVFNRRITDIESEILALGRDNSGS